MPKTDEAGRKYWTPEDMEDTRSVFYESVKTIPCQSGQSDGLVRRESEIAEEAK